MNKLLPQGGSERYGACDGETVLRDRLCGHVFELAPRAFYQANPPQAERLYALAVDMADPGPADTVLDLYCGAGTISLALAGRAGRVAGAELVPEAVANAAANAAANSMANAEFLCADAGEAARTLRARGDAYEAILAVRHRRSDRRLGQQKPPCMGAGAFARRLLFYRGNRTVMVVPFPTSLCKSISAPK